MMRTPFFPALLTALGLHVVGFTVLSFGWQAWHVALPLSQPSSPVLMAVVPVPEPTPPQPESPPEPVPVPEVDSVPEPLPPTPLLSAPIALPQQVEPTPPKRVEPRPNPTPPPHVTQAHQPKLPPARERMRHPAPVTSVQRESTPSPPPGPPNEPLGSAGSGSPGATPAPAVPVQETPQRPAPAEGTDAGRLFARGDVPVAPGPASSDKGGSEQGGAGSGAGDGAGTGRGGVGAGRGSGGTGRGGASARPIGGYQVKPRYPESARRRGIEGTALLKMRLRSKGELKTSRWNTQQGTQTWTSLPWKRYVAGVLTPPAVMAHQ
jgi:outer membrane biosynthesis protein TonB